MADVSQAPAVRRFGAFEINLRSGELRKNGMRLRLSGQPFQVLAILTERPGELVAREELHSKLWPADTFVDFDHGLNNAVARIREVLDDSSDTPRYIETIPRRGYRFIAPLTDVVPNSTASTAQPSSAPQTETSARATSSRAKWFSPRLALLFVTLLVVACIIGFLLYRTEQHSVKQPTIQSLAVLPLKNLSGDPNQDYLADGMTEELIGRLAKIRDLRVISRTSVMHFKDTKLLIPDIAKQLGVDAIVEGAVIRDGNRIRVHAQLIRAATDEHIWADQYERDFKSVFALEDDLTRNIAQQIEARLDVKQATRDSGDQADPMTYEDYLIGRYYFNQRTPDAVNKSITHFEQAIARDPNFALAYSGLADAYALLGYRGAYPSKPALSQAKEAALKAIELDPTLAEPHTSLAFIAETYEWDWASSEREYKRALELDPNDSRAHHFYASYLTYVQRFDEGIAEEKRARDLDPLSLPVNNALAGRLLAANRSQEALEQARATLDLDPNFAPVHQTLGWLYLKSGKSQESVQEFRRALELSGSNDIYLRSDLAFACAVTGNRKEAEKAITELKSLHAQGLAPSGSIAIIYGALGKTDEAFAWLDKAYQERDPELTYIKVGRRFDPLRQDHRLQELADRMGLPD